MIYIFYVFLHSHSSALRLFLRRECRRLCPRYRFRGNRADNARIVADKHHAQEQTGDFTQPAGTSEHEVRRRNQSCNVQPRHIASSEVSQKAAEHVEQPTAGGFPQEVRHPVQFRVRASHSLAYGRDRLSGFVFQFLHVFGRTCKGIRGGFADYGLTDDPCDTFVGGQFFPAHIADGSSGSGHFARLPGSPKGLRGMQCRMAGALSRRIGGLAHACHGLSAGVQ